MASRRSSKGWKHKAERRSLKNTTQTMAILSLTILAAIGLIGSYVFYSHKQSRIDVSNFCQKGVPDQVTVVLIDHTDQFNRIQTADVSERLKDIARHVPVNTALKLVEVTTNPDSLLNEEHMFCNPGDEDSVSELTGNKKKASKRYELLYKEKIDGILANMFTTGAKNTSPIMEAIQAVSVANFKGETAPKVKRLVIVSDLMQYTNSFSLYGGIPNFDDFEKFPFWNRIKVDLTNVDVEILFIKRNGESIVQNEKLLNFWNNFLHAQGAAHITKTTIDGAS